MANFLGVERRFNGRELLSGGPLPFWLRDRFLYLAILVRPTAIPVRELSQTSSVTVKICTIDEAASEAVVAWECMGKKPIDETNYEKSRKHICTLIGQVKGTSFRMLHGGREGTHGQKI